MKTHPLPPELSKEEQRVESIIRLMKELDGDKLKPESHSSVHLGLLAFGVYLLVGLSFIQTVLMVRGK